MDDSDAIRATYEDIIVAIEQLKERGHKPPFYIYALNKHGEEVKIRVDEDESIGIIR